MALIPSHSDAIVSVPKATKILLWLDIVGQVPINWSSLEVQKNFAWRKHEQVCSKINGR